jgi:hypothetical protein
MTVKEVLNKIKIEDVKEAMLSFEKKPYDREGIKDEYTLIYDGNEYPGRELIMRATKRQIKNTSNPKSYTTEVAKDKLIELGFTIFKDQSNMFRYYIKKVSNQDVEKTTVINAEAEAYFFGVSIPNRDDSAVIKIKYLPDNIINNEVKLIKKQDIRLFIDRARFKVGDILLFENIGNGEFSLRVKTTYDSDYLILISLLKNNYLLTNNLNDVNISDIEKEYQIPRMKKEIPLNQILFGPPGTGKTYNSITKSIEIVNPSFNTSQIRKLLKAEYDRLEKTDQILFSTFHQSMSYEDFIEGIKPQAPIANESLSYIIQDGIFKIASARAAYLCYKKYLELSGNSRPSYTFEDLYSAFIDSLKLKIGTGNFPIYKTITGKEVEIYEINSQDSIKARAKGSKVTKVAPLTQENFEKLYNKFKSISEISNLFEIKETVQVSPRSTEFYAVFGGLKEFEKSYLPDNIIEGENNLFDSIDDAEKVKKFVTGIYNEAIKLYGKFAEPVVLILDEINRGNVSQIFGELITLIEEDKRLGNPESLEIILPYSKKKFGVPPNLYIIGTMNTADRSVEALDTALRRRFVFEEIQPKYNLIELQYEYANVKGYEILQTINRRIEKLLDKDHLIGHSYFLIKNEENIKEELIKSFYKNIIPLLQEYFFGDFGKIGLVLGKGFVNLKSWNDSIDSFADFNHEGTGEFENKEVYEIIDYRLETNYEVEKMKMDFEYAVKLLMNLSIA